MRELSYLTAILLQAILVSWTNQIKLPNNLGAPIDCNAVNLTAIPKSFSNPCSHLENITSVIKKFTPANQMLTTQLFQSLFTVLKSKLAESYSVVKRQNKAIFTQFSSKDPAGLNATDLFISKLTNPSNPIILDNNTCNADINNIQNYELSLNPDGQTSAKKVFCLVISDMKKNMPVTIAYFMFQNGKAITTLQQTEKNNLAPLKALLVNIMGSKASLLKI